MICPKCRGTGKLFNGRFGEGEFDRIQRTTAWILMCGSSPSCPDCGGYGVVHCCEGDQAPIEPDREPEGAEHE